MYIIDTLAGCLGRLVADFAIRAGADDVEFAEDNLMAQWRVETRFFTIEFVYTKKQRLFTPASMLYSRVYFSKHDYKYFHILEFIDYVNYYDISCYYFPYIESEERMKACFEVLADFYLENFEKINDIALEPDKRKQLANVKRLEMKQMAELDFDDVQQVTYDYYEALVILARYTGDGPYFEFLKGNYDIALKKYQKLLKKDNCSSYDLKIIELLQNRKPGEKFEPIQPQCASIFEGKKFNDGKHEGIALLKGTAICEIVFLQYII